MVTQFKLPNSSPVAALRVDHVDLQAKAWEEVAHPRLSLGLHTSEAWHTPGLSVSIPVFMKDSVAMH